MGRKKSNRPVRTRQLPTIPRIFDCPRCEATAIRISVQSDVALVECGNCLLKQTVTNIKQVEEPIDIFGNFVDEYYKNIELHESSIPASIAQVPITPIEPQMEQTANTSDNFDDEETVTDEMKEESALASEDEEESEEDIFPMGFVPRTKGDVLKKKNKEKDTKKNKKASFSI